MKGIINIRDWIRTNGEMSEDGKSISYDCKELDTVISDALKQSDNVDLANVTTRDWVEKIPMQWKLSYYVISGIVIGYLLHNVW